MSFARHVLIGFFRGIKRTDIAMFLSIAHNVVLRFSCAYILAFALNLGAIGLWWSYVVTGFLGLWLTYLIYLSIKKKVIKRKICVEDIKIKSEAESEIGE